MFENSYIKNSLQSQEKIEYDYEAIFQRWKKVIDAKLEKTTQAQVARDLNISRSRLHRYLKRLDNLSLEVVVKLIIAYKEPAKYILTGEK